MGSLGKKLRRKKFNRDRKKILKKFRKLTPEEREKQADVFAGALEIANHHLEKGARSPNKPVHKSPTPEDVMNIVDQIKEDRDEENRKADTD